MQWGIKYNFFTEEELENFNEQMFMPKLRQTFDSRLQLQVFHDTVSREPVTRHKDTEFKGVPNYIQFLVPNTVNRDKTACESTSTFVEGEELIWKRRSILWWYSNCNHWSKNHNERRQCWVIQTRVS